MQNAGSRTPPNFSPGPFILTVTAVVSLLSAAPAQAQVSGCGVDTGGMLGVLGGVPIAAFEITASVGNGRHAINGEYSGSSWLAAGYVSSVLGIAYSTLLIGAGAGACDGSLLVNTGVIMGVLSVIDLSFTIWANTQPQSTAEQPAAYLELSPILSPDTGQGWFAGLGVRGRGL